MTGFLLTAHYNKCTTADMDSQTATTTVVHRLPIEMDTQLLLTIIIVCSDSIKAYKIRYNDCRKPTAIFKYTTADLCEENIVPEEKEMKAFHILQEIQNKRITGYSCQIIASRFTWYCGAYSHSKWALIPEIEVIEGMTPAGCSDMLNSKKFKGKDGISYKLELNTINIVDIVEVGSFSDKDNSVKCQGQQTRVAGELVDNIVIVASYKVILKEENYILNGGDIESESDHLILNCRPSRGGCRSLYKTYIWAKEMDDCPLRTVREIKVFEEDGYLIDEASNVVLKKLGTVAAPAGCTNAILHSTEYKNIFLTEDSTVFMDLASGMQLTTFVQARDDFIMWESEKKANELRKQFQRSLCDRQFRGQGTEGEVVKIGANNFALAAGETTYVFQCPEKFDTISNRDKCYQDIPIGIGTEGGFVTPLTRVYTSNSKEIECNPHFPTTVKAEQSWLELRPIPTPIAEPDKMPLDQHLEGKHQDVAAGGLYTDQEVRSWEQQLEQGRYHKSVLHQLTSGVCRNDGRCQTSTTYAEQPGYSLEQLVIPSPLTWLEHIKERLQGYTSILCAIVLFIEAMKFITTISMLTMALIREGLSGLVAVLTMLLCPAHQALSKIRRRAKKNRTERPLLMRDRQTDREKSEPEI